MRIKPPLPTQEYRLTGLTKSSVTWCAEKGLEMSEPISEDFIRAYGDVLPEGGCEHFIKEFERLTYSGAGSDRVQSEGALRHNKNDLQLNLNFGVHTMADFEEAPVITLFFDGVQACFNRYVEEFSVLKNDNIHQSIFKIC
jgi:hypothetical protein